MEAKILKTSLSIMMVIMLLSTDTPFWLHQVCVLLFVTYYLIKHYLSIKEEKEEN